MCRLGIIEKIVGFWRSIIICLLSVGSPLLCAHEVRPAYLEIREMETSTYAFLWKTPAQGDMRLALDVVLPDDCTSLGNVRTSKVNGAVVQSWRSQCTTGLLGKVIKIDNLEASLTDVILQYEPQTGESLTLRILGSEPQVKIPERVQGWTAAHTYFSFGLEHILSGIDHLLFVFCLLLLLKSRKHLLIAITAFTLAHSITLAATIFGWVHLASSPVEASIALSIVYLAAEIMRQQHGKSSAIQRWPWLAAFGFGLLHGFGFAAALSDMGLYEESIILALLFFNLGIEAGQILFVVCAISVWSLWQKYATKLPQIPLRYTSFSIGVVASYWFLERAMDIL